MEPTINFDFWEIHNDKELCDLATKVLYECYDIENITNTNVLINIIFTNSEQIQRINKEYRKMDKPTDVLSFPMFEQNEINNIINTKTPDVLGDIIISVEQVKGQAKEYGHSFERELAYMIVHGFYHLLGYDHMEEIQKQAMRTKEEVVLRNLNIAR